MEKGVLRRLFGFLRDSSDQRKANPPSDGDPGDKERPRLTAIEGRKGKEDGEYREGNERTKPCAVIGIPYSSDAVEETVEKEEESIMKSITKYMFVFPAVAAAAFALSACGGGGGGGGTTGAASAPVVSTGTMTKGSVVVNGIRFEDTAANITAKGTDSLTVLGQTVFVDGGTVFASVANFAALVVGNAVRPPPIESLEREKRH
jgi:hypothetical protein